MNANRSNNTTISSLTGLRFFAALTIMIAHLGGNIKFSFFGEIQHISQVSVMGMPLFFVLSGFVIHYVYNHIFSSNIWSTAAKEFFIARFSRIYPLFIFGLFISLIVQRWPTNVVKDSEYQLQFLLNILCVQSWWYNLSHSNAYIQSYYGWNWTISTEVFFYLLYPFISIWISSWKKAKNLIFGMVLFSLLVYTVFAVMFYYSEYVETFLNNRTLNFIFRKDDILNSFFRWFFYVSPYAHISEFILGCATAQLYLLTNKRPLTSTEKSYGEVYTWGALCVVLVLFIMYSMWCRDNLMASVRPITFQRLIIFFHMNYLFAPAFAFLIFCLTRYPSRLERFLSWEPVVFGGEISYSLYLLHPFIGYWISDTSQYIAVGLLRLFGAIVCAILFSTGTYYLIEQPAKKYIRKLFTS